MKKFIQKALPAASKGKLHKKLGVPLDEKIPVKKLVAAKKKAKPGSTLAKEINLANTLRKLKHKK